MADPEWTLARARYADKMRNRGTPLHVLPEEFERVHALIVKAHEYGMNDKMIAAQVGMNPMAIYKIRNRINRTVHRDSYESILTNLKPEPILSRRSPVRGKVPTGTQMDSTGTKRRLRALRVDGFSNRILGALLNVTPEAVSDLTRREATKVYRTTYLDVKAVYDKLSGSDPLDHGIAVAYLKQSKSWTRKYGWAPTRCWDDDTIDDPNAHPEWTGACGTEDGYRIHIRETIFEKNPLPLCDPCREAVETRSAIPAKIAFRHERFAELIEERGTNPRRLAVRVFGNSDMADSLYRWRQGARAPTNRGAVEAIAQALGVATGELIDEEATEQTEVLRAAGAFNPYILRVALEMEGMSHRKAADMSGGLFTVGSITKWACGQTNPSDPAKLKPLADHFGVDVSVFYG